MPLCALGCWLREVQPLGPAQDPERRSSAVRGESCEILDEDFLEERMGGRDWTPHHTHINAQ